MVTICRTTLVAWCKLWVRGDGRGGLLREWNQVKDTYKTARGVDGWDEWNFCQPELIQKDWGQGCESLSLSGTGSCLHSSLGVACLGKFSRSWGRYVKPKSAKRFPTRIFGPSSPVSWLLPQRRQAVTSTFRASFLQTQYIRSSLAAARLILLTHSNIILDTHLTRLQSYLRCGVPKR